MGTRSSNEPLSSEPEQRSAVEGLPPLLAEAFVLGGRECQSQVAASIPGEMPDRQFDSVDAYVDALSGQVALAVLSVELPDDRLERVVRETLRASEHARIVLVATDGAELLRCEVPYDDAFVLPADRESFDVAIEKLYVQAYYSLILDRYYRIGLAINNHDTTAEQDGESEDGKLRQWQAKHRRLRSYLDRFRQFLGSESFRAIATRSERFDDLVGSAGQQGNPSAIGLPESCPDCGLDWTTWHDSKLGTGHEQIGANTWRCTRCGHTLADDDPKNYRIG
jgi:hypothetical protein